MVLIPLRVNCLFGSIINMARPELLVWDVLIPLRVNCLFG